RESCGSSRSGRYVRSTCPTYPTYPSCPASRTYPACLEVETEAHMDNPRREDRRRRQIRRADGDVVADDRSRVADVEEIELRHELPPLAETNRPRDAQIDHRHRRQPLVAAIAQEHVLVRARQRDARCRRERARDR